MSKRSYNFVTQEKATSFNSSKLYIGLLIGYILETFNKTQMAFVIYKDDNRRSMKNICVQHGSSESINKHILKRFP